MSTTQDYIDLLPSESKVQPDFLSVLSTVVAPVVSGINANANMFQSFDLDTAVGVQLDVIGQWVGASRYLTIPLTGIYFALDTALVGFDQGAWQGPYDPTTGITQLDDETYRFMLKAKIGANHWDSSLPVYQAILTQLFTGTGVNVLAQDRMDMTMDVVLTGPSMPLLLVTLVKNGYLSLKPSGVQVHYLGASIPGGTVFGFDFNNSSIQGFDTGSWAVPL